MPVLTASEHVKTNLPVLRRRAGFSSQVKLAERMAELGTPMHHTVIAKIENGDRGVSVDDLVALAAALDVSPLRLLLPANRRDDVPGLRLGAKAQHVISEGTAWRWGEQVEPWWSDEPAEDADPTDVRMKTWAHLTLDNGTLAYVRYADPDGNSAEEKVDASGGLPAVLAELHELRKGDYGRVLAELRELRRILQREKVAR